MTKSVYFKLSTDRALQQIDGAANTDHLRIVNRQKGAVYVTETSPMVEINVELKASSENLNRTQVFPTPESPINSNLNK